MFWSAFSYTCCGFLQLSVVRSFIGFDLAVSRMAIITRASRSVAWHLWHLFVLLSRLKASGYGTAFGMRHGFFIMPEVLYGKVKLLIDFRKIFKKIVSQHGFGIMRAVAPFAPWTGYLIFSRIE